MEFPRPSVISGKRDFWRKALKGYRIAQNDLNPIPKKSPRILYAKSFESRMQRKHGGRGKFIESISIIIRGKITPQSALWREFLKKICAFNYKNRRIFVSNALNGYQVGVLDSDEKLLPVYFCELFVRYFDTSTFTFSQKNDWYQLTISIKSTSYVVTLFC